MFTGISIATKTGSATVGVHKRVVLPAFALRCKVVAMCLVHHVATGCNKQFTALRVDYEGV